MSHLRNVLTITAISFTVVVGFYLYFPLSWFDLFTEPILGSTITTIQGSDTLSASRSVINTNFSNLNTDKLESGSSAASLTITNLTNTNASTTALSCYGICAFGATATSSFSTAGALTLASALGVVSGGTGATSYTTGSIPFSNGTILTQNNSKLFWDNTNIRLGISSTTPFASLSIATGTIAVAEYTPATTTSMTLNWLYGTQQRVRLGGAATAIAHTGYIPGQTLRVYVCNPAATAGAITWSGVLWPSATTPTQTTTANKCDLWTFNATAGTSTPIVIGSAVLNL